MGILDFVLIAFLLVTVIIGLKKGFAKMISNLLCILVALAGSVVATIFLVGLAKQLPLFLQLQGVALRWFPQAFMTAQVTSQEHLVTLLSGEDAGIFSVLGGISSQIYAGMQSVGAQSLGSYLGYLIATVIVAFVIWLVCYLILKYILLGIKKLLCLIAKIPVLKSIDKVAGVIFSVLVGYIFVFGVLYSALAVVCARFVPTLGAQVIALVDSSSIFTYVHHTNFIGEMLCSLFKVDYSTFALMV